MLSDNASVILFLDIDSAIYMHELALQKNPKYLYQHIIPLSLFFFHFNMCTKNKNTSLKD